MLTCHLILFRTMTGNAIQTEKDILSLAKRGDDRFMRLLYDRYVGCLAAVCGRYIGDEDDRKDILQEAFIKIFTSIGRFEHRGEGSLKAWIIRITANEAIKFLRRNATYKFIEYEETLPDVEEEPEVDGVPDGVINDMILTLPSGYRTVFNLYVFGNKSHKEIAQMLGIGESSSASQFLRAKAQLAKRMREYKQTHQND